MFRLVFCTNVITYQYNDSGIRTSKTVDGVTTTYYIEGGNIAWQTDGTNTIHYTYDAKGDLVYMNLNGQTYYYERNGQNDIIGILDASGNQVVTYSYDTWGKLLGIGGSQASGVGTLNPFRYRGYYYDTETGLFYVVSRYYDPTTGSFTQEDTYWGDVKSPASLNLYTYCNNNPVLASDPSGHSAYPGSYIRRGSSGSYVSQVQSQLNATIGAGLAVDGDFGPKTEAAVRSFQSSRGLSADGIVGPQTWGALFGGNSGGGGSSSPAPSSSGGSAPKTVTENPNTTQQVAKALMDNPVDVAATQSGATDGLLNSFDFEKDNSGVYHTNQDCWQQYGGYSDLYDSVFNVATSMNRVKFPFYVGNTEYIIWMWKGDYLNLGAGGEVGIYDNNCIMSYLSGNTWFEASTGNALGMTLHESTSGGQTVFDWNPGMNDWWITGFNPQDQNIAQQNLILSGTIDFSGRKKLWNSFYSTYNGNRFWSFSPSTYTASFRWQ